MIVIVFFIIGSSLVVISEVAFLLCDLSISRCSTFVKRGNYITEIYFINAWKIHLNLATQRVDGFHFVGKVRHRRDKKRGLPPGKYGHENGENVTVMTFCVFCISNQFAQVLAAAGFWVEGDQVQSESYCDLGNKMRDGLHGSGKIEFDAGRAANEGKRRNLQDLSQNKKRTAAIWHSKK